MTINPLRATTAALLASAELKCPASRVACLILAIPQSARQNINILILASWTDKSWKNHGA